MQASAAPREQSAALSGLHSARRVFPPLLFSGPSMNRYLGTSPQWGSWGRSQPAGMRGQKAEERVPRREPYHKPLCSPLPQGLVTDQPQAIHPALGP